MSINSLGFLGGGNMGEALIRGALSALPALSLGVLEKNTDRVLYLQSEYPELKIIDNTKILGAYTAIIIAVKPQQFDDATSSLAQSINKGTLIISVAAGIPLSRIAAIFPLCPCIRVMPNTPALIGKGMTGIAFGKQCTPEHTLFAEKLFSSIGEVISVPETQMNAVTAVSGSGPAYFYHLIDVMANQAVSLGLSYDVAAALFTQTMLGSAMMIQSTQKTPADLIKQVMSPGGTTEAAMKKLIASDLSSVWREALNAANKRAEELSQ